MNIRHVSPIILLLTLLISGETIAQSSESTDDRLSAMRQARALLTAGRGDIIREEIRLSDEESAAFWPVYERYRAELQIVMDRYAELLTSYLQAYYAGTVSEKMANRVVDDYLQIQADILNIKLKYRADFREALAARKAARLYQLENKVELELEAELSLIVPLIDPV